MRPLFKTIAPTLTLPRALASAFFLSLTALPSAAFADTAGDALRAVQWMQARPAYAELLEKGLKRSGQTDAVRFLTSIPQCPPGSRYEGLVRSQSGARRVYFARDLDELTQSTPDLERYVKLATAANLGNFQVKFDGELVEVRFQNQVIRQVCIKASPTFEDQVELLVHELTHLTAPDEPPLSLFDIAALGDPVRYGRERVNALGDEVDAYIAEYSVRIQLRGKGALNPPYIASLFSDSGQWLGNRDSLRNYILDNLGYQRVRFDQEYRDNLKAAEQALGDRKRLLIELINHRTTEEARFSERAKKAQNSADRETATRFSQAASDSRQRSMQTLGDVTKQLSEVQKQNRN